MLSRLWVLYSVVLVVAFQLVILAVFYCGLSLPSKDPSYLVERPAVPWEATRNRAARRAIHHLKLPAEEAEENEGPAALQLQDGLRRFDLDLDSQPDLVSSQSLEKVFSRSSEPPRNLGGAGDEILDQSLDKVAHGAPDESLVQSPDKTARGAAKELIQSPGNGAVDRHLQERNGAPKDVSSERWKRLKRPSMLLDTMDDYKKMQLEADSERLKIMNRERNQREELLQSAKSEKAGAYNVKPRPYKKQTVINIPMEKEEKAMDGKEKDGMEYQKRKMAETMIRESQKSKELNQQWEKRKRDKTMSILEGSIPKMTPEEYFKEICEETTKPLLECSGKPRRNLTSLQAAGGDIMLTIRTTVKYHDTRLPVMFETWLGDVDPTNVFIVTDGEDEDLIWQTNSLGIHYVDIAAGGSHGRSDLCCKAGEELELMMAPENSKFNWICHVDDDMYVNPAPLVQSLSHFDPTKEKVYYGRSGSPVEAPRQVRNDSTLGKPGKRYFFALGGMYCLSRAMVEEARPYLVGCNAFSSSCNKTKEPEDVTVGLVIGVVLNHKLTWTEMIYTHGGDLLSSTPSANLIDQVAFSYGFGSVGQWSIIPNVVYVPGGLYNIDEDITQFKSLHCHFYPKTQWCVDKKEQVVEDKKRRALQQEPETPWTCECMWKKIICCQVYKDNYHKYMVNKMLEYKDNKDSVSNRDSASSNRDSASNNRDSASSNRDSVGNKESASEGLDRVKGKQAEAKSDYA